LNWHSKPPQFGTRSKEALSLINVIVTLQFIR
jgi:hypothetical protein